MKTIETIDRTKIRIDLHNSSNGIELHGGMQQVVLYQDITKTLDYGVGIATYNEHRECNHYIPINMSFLDFEEELESLEDAVLYEMIGNTPIALSEADLYKYNISLGLPLEKHYNLIGHLQVIREETVFDEELGRILLDKNNNVQYKRTLFSKVYKKDIDYRYHQNTYKYITPSINTELQDYCNGNY